MYNFYNPDTHKGELPVRVLANNYLVSFEDITPNFKDESKGEIDFNGLKPGIIYNVSQSKVVECACINSSREIELFENFNQYLWCICYALLTIFDESIQKPMMAGAFTRTIDYSNPFIRKGVNVFNAGTDLLTGYKVHEFFSLPNPERYCEVDKEYIEKANAIFTASMTFVLLHEFAHQFFGHLDYKPTIDESKNDEYAADEYAIDKIAYNFDSVKGPTYKMGIIAGISSLILLDKSLDGGNSHPDVDDRLSKAMEKLKLEERHSFWGIASLTFTLWAKRYDNEINLPAVVENYKQLFEITLQEIKSFR